MAWGNCDLLRQGHMVRERFEFERMDRVRAGTCSLLDTTASGGNIDSGTFVLKRIFYTDWWIYGDIIRPICQTLLEATQGAAVQQQSVIQHVTYVDGSIDKVGEGLRILGGVRDLIIRGEVPRSTVIEF